MFQNLAQDWTKNLDRESSMALLQCYALRHEAHAVNTTALRYFINRCTLLTTAGTVIDHPAHPLREHSLHPSYADTDYVSHGMGMEQYPDATTDVGAWEVRMNRLLEETTQEFFWMPSIAAAQLLRALWVLASHHPTARIRTWWRVAYEYYVGALNIGQPKPYAVQS